MLTISTRRLGLPCAVLLLGLITIACSGSSTTVSSGADGGDDGSSQGDGGCISPDPAEGSACVTGQNVCTDGVDACCRGYAWFCDPTTHKWTKAGLGCACLVDAGGRDSGPFTCGSQTCTPDQYCETGSGGAVQPDGGTRVSYACKPLPDACIGTATCACVKAHGVSCSSFCADSAGHVEVQCLYP